MAVYIPCTTGTCALYRQDDEHLAAVPVEAWGDNGVPYVAGTSGLIAAAERAGFLRLEQASAIVPSPTRPVRQPERRDRPPRSDREELERKPR